MTDQDIKTRIRDKAGDLFMQYGIRSMSMDDIAFHLGMSKKTIYQYYADKDELVDEVVAAKISESESCCEKDREKAKDAVDEIFQVMEMVDEMLRNMNPAVLFDMQKYHAKAYGKFQKHKDEFVFSTVKDNLIRGISEGLYRPEINVEIIARFRVEIMMLSFNHSFVTRQNSSLLEIEQQLIEHYLYGIASLKGHELILKYKQARLIKKANHENVN